MKLSTPPVFREPLGRNMMRLLWLTAILLVMTLGGAFADSVRIGLIPNDGSGDNFGILQTVGGVTIGVGGGVPFDFFNIGPYLPGSMFGGQTDVFIDGGVIIMGGIPHELTPDGLGSLLMSSFTLPANGQNFRAFVRLDFSATMINVDTNQPIDVSGGASGSIKFNFSDGVYTPSSFIQAPEPGTLGLMGSGLMGILALARRRLRL